MSLNTRSLSHRTFVGARIKKGPLVRPSRLPALVGQPRTHQSQFGDHKQAVLGSDPGGVHAVILMLARYIWLVKSFNIQCVVET